MPRINWSLKFSSHFIYFSKEFLILISKNSNLLIIRKEEFTFLHCFEWFIFLNLVTHVNKYSIFKFPNVIFKYSKVISLIRIPINKFMHIWLFLRVSFIINCSHIYIKNLYYWNFSPFYYKTLLLETRFIPNSYNVKNI